MWTKKQLPSMVARREARRNSFAEYIGSPCRTCGNKLRYTSTASCMLCTRQHAARQYAERKATNVPS